MLIQQNERADTVLVFRWVYEDGLCASLFRMLYFFALCRRKGYYFILDDQKFGAVPYTDVFKPFWNEETNRSMLESVKHIHLFPEYCKAWRDNDCIILSGYNLTRSDERILNYKYGDLASVAARTFRNRPWEPRILHDAAAYKNYQQLTYLGAKHGLFAEEDIARSWDDCALASLLSEIYQLQDHVQEQVDNLKQTVNLPEDYQAIQVRRKREHIKITYNLFRKRPPPLAEYLSGLDSDIRNIYVATDEEYVVKSLQREETGIYQYHSFIQENKKPHVRYDAKSRQERIASAVYLLTDLELCTQAKRFIGTEHSTVSDVVLLLRQNLGKEINRPPKWKRSVWHEILFIRMFFFIKFKLGVKYVLRKLNLIPRL